MMPFDDSPPVERATLLILVVLLALGLTYIILTREDSSAKEKEAAYVPMQCEGRVTGTSTQSILVECTDGRRFNFTTYKYSHRRTEM